MAKNNNNIETRVSTRYGDATVHVVAVGTAQDGAASYINLEEDLKRQYEPLVVEVVEEKPGIYAFVKVRASLGEDAVVCEGECNGETNEETKMARRYPYKTAKSRATTAALMELFELPVATLPENVSAPAKTGWNRQNPSGANQVASPAKPAWNAQAQPVQQNKPAWNAPKQNTAPAQQPAWGAPKQNPGQTAAPAKSGWGNQQSAKSPANRSWGSQNQPVAAPANAATPAPKRTWSPQNSAPATATAPARPWSVPEQQPNPYGAVNQVAQDVPVVNADPTITVGPYAGALLSEVMALPDGQDWVNDFIGRQPMTEDEASLLTALQAAMGVEA